MQNNSDDHSEHTTIRQSSAELFGHSLNYLSNLFELANLEIKYSSQMFKQSLIYILIASILGLSSWLLALMGISVLLHEFGLSWAYSILIVCATNIALCFLCLFLAKLRSKEFGFSRTLAQIKLLATGDNS
jgi:hypothetical protein